MEEERPAEKSPRKRRSWSEELRGEREVGGGERERESTTMSPPKQPTARSQQPASALPSKLSQLRETSRGSWTQF